MCDRPSVELAGRRRRAPLLYLFPAPQLCNYRILLCCCTPPDLLVPLPHCCSALLFAASLPCTDRLTLRSHPTDCIDRL